MKFMVARKDGIKCQGCPGFIERGDEMVMSFIKEQGNTHILCWHLRCYIPWFIDMFNRKWSEWKNGIGNSPLPPKRGRPVKYTEPTTDILLNRLRASMCYHKKLGHDIRVKILQGKIQRITG